MRRRFLTPMPVLRNFGFVVQSGTRFPNEVAVSAPRGSRPQPGLPRGFSRPHWRTGRIAKREPSSRKTIRFLACGRYRDGLLFRSRRRGNPTTGQNDGRLSGRSGWKVGKPKTRPKPKGRETGRKAEPKGRETGRKVQPEAKGQPEATGGRQTERGSFGIVERTDG